MLNEEVVDSLQKVNINLVFYGDNVTINIQRDKALDVIHRTAYDYFKPHGKIKLYYKNKELTPYLNYTIAKYFQKLKKIDILVKDTARMDSNLENQLILNSNLNINEITNNKNNTVLDDNSDLKNNNVNNKNILPQNKRAMSYCWDCKKFPINIFCRDCCAFICKYCRMDLDNSHYSHRTITLYPENLAKSANLYKNVLIEDLNEVQKINKNAQKIAKDNSEINIDIEGYKTHLFEKVNRLLKKIKQIKSYQKEINYYINNKEKCKEKINKAIQDVKNISNEYNNQKIGEINEENPNNNNNKSNIGDLKDIFTRMNNIEKNTQKICNIGKTIEEWEDINSRLEIALKTVENKIYSIITEAMNDGSGKPKDKKDNNNNGYNNNNDNNINNDNINNNKDSNNYENQQNQDEKKGEEFETKNEENKQDNQSQLERDEGQGEREEEGKVTDNIHNTGNIDNENPKEETLGNNKGDVKEIKIKGLNKDEEKEPINQNAENGGGEEYEEYEEEVEEEVEQ